MAVDQGYPVDVILKKDYSVCVKNEIVEDDNLKNQEIARGLIQVFQILEGIERIDSGGGGILLAQNRWGN